MNNMTTEEAAMKAHSEAKTDLKLMKLAVKRSRELDKQCRDQRKQYFKFLKS